MRFVEIPLALILLTGAVSAQFLPDVTLTPVRVAVGSGDTTVTVSGTDLKPSFQARWNGQARPTTFVSPWTLKVVLFSSDLAQPGLSWISLWDLDRGAHAANDLAFLVYLPLKSWDLLADSSRARIYASLAQADANGPSVAIIDPAKGTVERYLPLPAEPGVMALSSGYRYLYVALTDRIRRIDLSAANAILDIPFSGQVASILPLPGAETSFVAVFGNGPYSALAFDGATRRPNQSNDAPRCLIDGNGTALYGGPGFHMLRLDANGMPFTAEVSINTLLAGRACPVSAGGLLYGSNGDVVDPSGPTRVGHFAASGLIEVAQERRQSYFLGLDGFPARLSLMVFDTATYAPLSRTYLPLSLNYYGGRLVHWGADGVAFGDYGTVNSSVSNGVYLLHTKELNQRSMD